MNEFKVETTDTEMKLKANLLFKGGSYADSPKEEEIAQRRFPQNFSDQEKVYGKIHFDQEGGR